MKRILLASFIILFSLSALFSESFRVRKAHIIKLENTSAEFSAGECNIYDAVGIYLPEGEDSRDFIEGVEIKMVIPEAIASWRNSIAATIYDKISPEPSDRQIDYSGTRLFVNALPGKLSWVIQVPLKKENSIKENQYSTKIDTIPRSDCTNIFLKFQPVMKGIPEEVMNALITVSAKPIFSDKGKLKLNLTLPPSAETPQDTPDAGYTVYIDDVPVTQANSHLLKTGIHNISIVSENYRNEMRTFYIQQAKTTPLDIQLKSVEPSLIISAPDGDGVKVFLDGNECTDSEKLSGKEFVISEGDHTVKFVIGNYEVVRSLKAVKGRTYRANLEVELTISDGED